MWMLVIAQALGAIIFATVAQGNSSQIQQPREIVVRSAGEWETLWNLHSSHPLPEVDFSQSLVVGVFVGMRPTAGYGIEITAVSGDDDHVVVEYRERRPAPDAFMAQVLTAPFHLVSLPRAVGRIDFRKDNSEAEPL